MRAKMYLIDSGYIAQMFETGNKSYFEVTDGIPLGSELRNTTITPDGVVRLLMENNIFEEVPKGGEVPYGFITVRTIPEVDI